MITGTFKQQADTTKEQDKNFAYLVQFVAGQDGYEMPVYPTNPTPEERAYIIKRSLESAGKGVHVATVEEIFFSIAASRLYEEEAAAKRKAEAESSMQPA